MSVIRVFGAFALAGAALLVGPATAVVGGQSAPGTLQDSTDRSIARRMEAARIVGLGAAIIVASGLYLLRRERIVGTGRVPPLDQP